MGGVEAYTKNLLYGFSELNEEFGIELYVNPEVEEKLKKEINFDNRFKFVTLNVNPHNIKKVFVYQFTRFHRFLKNRDINVYFLPTPIYPLRKSKVPSVVTIHDLQFLHYPEYTSFIRRKKYYISCKYCLKNSTKVVAISNFVKNDILKHFNVDPDKIEVIYNPIRVSKKLLPFDELSKKYGIKQKEYFYTISSLLPHKNTMILLDIFAHDDFKKLNVPKKLVITGVGKPQDQKKVIERARQLKIEDNIILTGFISDQEKDTLLANAYAFLFPSLFEGFGMPPVEAMILGIPVVTTKQPAIYETTQGKALYVDNPYNVKAWMSKIAKLKSLEADLFKNWKHLSETYSPIKIATKYYQLFEKVASLQTK